MKKALSAIIASAILISLTVIAVTMLYFSINNLIQLSPASNCLEKQNSRPVILGDICYDSIQSVLKIPLQKNTEEEIKSLEFKVSKSGNTEMFQCGSGCQNCKIPQSGSKTYILFTEFPESLEIFLDSCSIKEVKVKECLT